MTSLIACLIRYEIRKEENKRFAAKLGIDFVDVDGDVDEWYRRAKGMEFCPLVHASAHHDAPATSPQVPTGEGDGVLPRAWRTLLHVLRHAARAHRALCA